jgi:hypothetical protein
VATLSVRGIAASCLGLSGSLSVNSDLYGYIFRDTDGSLFGTLSGSDTLPATGAPRTRSLRQHLTRISGRSTDLVMILVGHENDFSGAVSRDQATKAQYAVQIVRDIYAQAQLGVRRIRWQRIPLADAGGYVNISDRGEAQDLTDDWSGPGGGIDVFLVQSIGDAGGWSNVTGPCDKTSKFDLSGAVVELSSGRRFLGVLTAHEVGHYLGLKHASSLSNLMGADTNDDGIGEINNNSTGLTSSQRTKMHTHCSVRSPC